MTPKHTNKQIQEKPNKFEIKYGNQENIRKPESISNTAKNLYLMKSGKR